MIRELDDMPERVIGFSAEGTVTGEDYTKVLIPAVEVALAKGGKVRLLYVIGPEFHSYDLGAMWDDAVLGVEHFFAFEKIAVVSDHELLAALMRSFSLLMPAAVRVFSMAHLEAAKAWLAE